MGGRELGGWSWAADRGQPALTRFRDARHPAVLRGIKQIATEAPRHGKQVSVCGEAASDPATARLLIGLGVDELSLSPAGIPRLKSTLRATKKAELETLAERALALP